MMCRSRCSVFSRLPIKRMWSISKIICSMHCSLLEYKTPKLKLWDFCSWWVLNESCVTIFFVTFYLEKLYGDSGRLQREPFRRILNHFLKLPTKELDQLFIALDKTSNGFIVFEDFLAATEKDERFKRLYAPNRNFRQKWNAYLTNNYYFHKQTHEIIWNITNVYLLILIFVVIDQILFYLSEGLKKIYSQFNIYFYEIVQVLREFFTNSWTTQRGSFSNNTWSSC